MRYLSIPVLLLAGIAVGTSAPSAWAASSPPAAATAWVVPVKLLRQTFPAIYGSVKATNPPTTMQLTTASRFRF